MTESDSVKQHQKDTNQRFAVPRSWWLTGLIGLLFAAGLPVIGQHLRKGHAARCALDGQEIDPSLQVTIVTQDGELSVFCGILCAEMSLKQSMAIPHQVLVTDELTSKSLDAGNAHYVRSAVVSNSHTGDRRHVFGQRAAAELHATTFHGRILTGNDRPFSGTPSLSSPNLGTSSIAPSVEEQRSS